MTDPTYISSPSNSTIKYIRQLLSQKKHRNAHFILEHTPSLLEFSSHDPSMVDTLIVCEDTPLPPQLNPTISVLRVTENIFRDLTSIKTSKGLIGIMKKPKAPSHENLATLEAGSSIFFLDGIQQPSNIGAIIRNAAAFNVKAIGIGPGCADPFHPDAVRAMAGACYSLPIYDLDITSIVSHLVAPDVIVLDINEEASPLSDVLAMPAKGVSIFVFGSEGQGPTKNTLSDLNKAKHNDGVTVKTAYIPIHNVESLNVAAASAIVGYTLGVHAKNRPAD